MAVEKEGEKYRCNVCGNDGNGNQSRWRYTCMLR